MITSENAGIASGNNHEGTIVYCIVQFYRQCKHFWVPKMIVFGQISDAFIVDLWNRNKIFLKKIQIFPKKRKSDYELRRIWSWIWNYKEFSVRVAI